jgi:hypothetical protein
LKKAGQLRENWTGRSIDVVKYVYSFFRSMRGSRPLLEAKELNASLIIHSTIHSYMPPITDISSLSDHPLHVHHNSLLRLARNLRRPIPQAPIRRDQLRRTDRSDIRIGRFASRRELAGIRLDKSGTWHASLSSCQRWEGSCAFLLAQWQDCV